jgi:hypothetical protein
MSKKNGTDALNQSVQAKRFNLAEWRVSMARPHDLVLPSGLEVKVRDISLVDLLLAGEIPNTLESFGDIPDVTKPNEISREQIEKSSDIMNMVVTAVLLEPKVGDTPDETHVTLAELRFADKNYILEYVNRDANAVRPFREGTTEPAQAA